MSLIDLSSFYDAAELPKDVTDRSSQRIDIPDGLVLGENIVTSAYVRVLN